MSTLRIDLLRHGETTGGGGFRGRLDDPLTPAGRQQMEAVVDGVGDWDRLVSSPLRRCTEFARGLATRRNMPLELEAAWRELDFGLWEGRTAEQLMAQTPQALTAFWRDPEGHPPPEGEPLPQFRERVLAAWAALSQRRRVERLLVVTHAGPIRVVLGQVLGRPLREVLGFQLDHAALVRFQVQWDTEGRAATRVLQGLPREQV